MIVGNGTYELQGTSEQISILAPCFISGEVAFIRFPWDVLNPPHRPIPIGWMDLNAAFIVDLRNVPAYETEPRKTPGHVHLTDSAGNVGHAVLRLIDGRRWIAGVFWSDGRIYVDTRCGPDLAREVVSAELAHSVDYFLPLLDDQKAALMALWHPTPDEHTWWEKEDYGAEYYDLGGETFMAAFTLAYSNMVPDQTAWIHQATKEQAPAIRTILGVGTEGSSYLRIGRGRRYHRKDCWVVRLAQMLNRDIQPYNDGTLTPCRICKPS